MHDTTFSRLSRSDLVQLEFFNSKGEVVKRISSTNPRVEIWVKDAVKVKMTNSGRTNVTLYYDFERAQRRENISNFINNTIVDYRNNIKDEEKLTPTPEKEQIEGNQFSDVSKNDFFFFPVLWAVEKSITKGTTDTTFSPNEACTRAQAVTFLWRAAGSPNPTNTNMPFTDVKAGSYYEKAVLWAVEKGITNGISATKFGVDNTCTREQIVTFIWRANGQPKVTSNNPFSDVKSSMYAYDAILWAVGKNITKGTSATVFSPTANCTRGQIVTFLYRDKN